jgi:hypothetical protein
MAGAPDARPATKAKAAMAAAMAGFFMANAFN